MHLNNIKIEKAVDMELLNAISWVGVLTLIGSISFIFMSGHVNSIFVQIGFITMAISGGAWFFYGKIKDRISFRLLGAFLVVVCIGSFIL